DMTEHEGQAAVGKGIERPRKNGRSVFNRQFYVRVAIGAAPAKVEQFDRARAQRLLRLGEARRRPPERRVGIAPVAGRLSLLPKVVLCAHESETRRSSSESSASMEAAASSSAEFPNARSSRGGISASTNLPLISAINSYANPEMR